MKKKNKVGLLGHLNRDTYKITETNLDQVTGNIYFSSKQLNPKYTGIMTEIMSNSQIQSDGVSDEGKMLAYLADTKQEIRLGLENDKYGIKKDEFSQAGLSLMKHYITDNAYNKDWSESDKTLYGLNKLIYQEVKDGYEKQVYLGINGMSNGGNKIENVGKGEVSLDSTDAVNGSQLYAVIEALNAIQTINLDDIADVITTEVNITGGDNVQVNREGNNFTISATDTNNHDLCYSAKGINNNLAESFNARFRDLHRGVHHKCDNKYALHYANQAAFMSDNRQKSNGELFSDILKRCLWVLLLREWVGYWQGNHRTQELIGMTAFSPEEISQSYFKNLNERMKYEQELLAA